MRNARREDGLVQNVVGVIAGLAMLVLFVYVWSAGEGVGLWVVAGYSGYTVESSIVQGSLGTQMILLTVWMVYVCWLYVQYGSSVGLCWEMYNVALVLFLVTSVWFFVCSDLVSVLLAFEMGNVPLVIMLVGANAGRLVGHVGVKGVLQGVWVLLGYGVMSGACLVLGLWCRGVWGIEMVMGVNKWDDSEGIESILVLVCWCLVGLAGMVKVALVPMHVWLAKVHGESATIGSVLLAGIALKVGFVLHWKGLLGVGALVSGGSTWWILLGVLVGGTVWVCVSLLWVVDVKRWIAVYSIGHVGVLY